jgi:hypothetical protein
MGHGAGKGSGMAQGHANGLQGLVTAVARSLGIGHGNANAPGMAHGPGKGQAIGHGNANAPGMAHGPGKGQAIGHGNANAPGMAHGAGKGQAIGHGNANAPGVAHGPGKGQAIGRGDANASGVAHGAGKGQAVNQQTDPDMTFNPATIDSHLDDIVTLGLSPNQELQPDRGLTLTLGLPRGHELQADSSGRFNPEMIHSDLDGIVSLGRPLGQDLQPDRSNTLNLGPIHSDLNDIASRGLRPRLEVHLHRGKSLPASSLAKVTSRTSALDVDDTFAIAPQDRRDLNQDYVKMLSSIVPGLDDDNANEVSKLPWGIALNPLVPCLGALLLFLLGILNSGLTGQRIRKREQLAPSAARPPALDKFTATFLMIRERQQKAAEEKKGPVLEQLSGDSDVEEARAQIEHAQGIDPTSPKNFNGIGLS